MTKTRSSRRHAQYVNSELIDRVYERVCHLSTSIVNVDTDVALYMAEILDEAAEVVLDLKNGVKDAGDFTTPESQRDFLLAVDHLCGLGGHYLLLVHSIKAKSRPFFDDLKPLLRVSCEIGIHYVSVRYADYFHGFKKLKNDKRIEADNRRAGQKRRRQLAGTPLDADIKQEAIRQINDHKRRSRRRINLTEIKARVQAEFAKRGRHVGARRLNTIISRTLLTELAVGTAPSHLRTN